MQEKVKKNLFFYANVVHFQDEDEKQRDEVKDYLYKWKKYLLRDLPKEAKFYPDEEGSEQFLERKAIEIPSLFIKDKIEKFRASSSLRLCFEYDGSPTDMKWQLGYVSEYLGKDET